MIAKVKHPVKGVAQGAWKILALDKGLGCNAACFDFHKRLLVINFLEVQIQGRVLPSLNVKNMNEPVKAGYFQTQVSSSKEPGPSRL